MRHRQDSERSSIGEEFLERETFRRRPLPDTMPTYYPLVTRYDDAIEVQEEELRQTPRPTLASWEPPLELEVGSAEYGGPAGYSRRVYEWRSPKSEQFSPRSEQQSIQIRRGKMLIQNHVDTVTAPQTVDLVESEEEDDQSGSSRLHVDDNTNMFDSQFRVSRENPAYYSGMDSDRLSKHYRHEQQPTFASAPSYINYQYRQ